MDDQIARIDQHPVTGRLALNPGIAHAGLLEGLGDLIGERTDMARRAARRDDHSIGKLALPRQLDHDNIFGLVIIEGFENALANSLNTLRGGKTCKRIIRSSDVW